jgi:hypothetical protein
MAIRLLDDQVRYQVASIRRLHFLLHYWEDENHRKQTA